MARPEWVRELVLERIEKLFEQAEKEFPKNPGRSNRYVELAHKISKKYNVTIPKQFKKRYCPECHRYWVPDKTVKVRLDSSNHRVLYICLECSGKRTYGYSEESKNVLKG